MILKLKPFTVGCGKLLNPNGSDDRCGRDKYSEFYGKKMYGLCDACSVKKQANALMDILKEKDNAKA